MVSSQRNGSDTQSKMQTVQFRPALHSVSGSAPLVPVPKGGNPRGGVCGGKAVVRTVLPVARPGCSDGTVT